MNKWMLVGFAVLLCVAILFCCLWIDEKNSHEDLEFLCQASAAQCLTALRDYDSSGNEGSYMKAVAEFRTFMNSYGWLMEGKGKSLHYNICGKVYGCLVYDQDASKALIGDLTKAVRLLAADIFDENAYLQLNGFVNAVEHGTQ